MSYISAIILFIDFFLLIKNKKNRFLTVLNIFIFYFDFSCLFDYYIAMSDYWNDNTVLLASSEKGNVLKIGFYLICINTFSRFVFLYNAKEDKLDNLKYIKNDIALIVLIVISALIIIAFDRSSSDAYEIKSTPIYEYLKIIFVLMFILSHKSKARFIIVPLIFIAIFQDLISGGRVFFIQSIIAICFFVFPKHIDIKRLVYIPFLILLSNIVGKYRTDYTINYDKIKESFSFINDTFTHAFFGGLTVIYSSQYIPFRTRITSFICFFLETFLGSTIVSRIFSNTFLQDTTNIVHNAVYYHWNIGGSYFPVFFYFWGGFILTFLLSMVFWFFIRIVLTQDNQYCILSSIIILITTPRWFTYNFNSLFRSCFLFFVLYFLIKISSFNLKSKTNYDD